MGEIFVCSWRSIPDHMEFYWSLKTADIHLRILPVSLSIATQIPKIEMIGGMPTIHYRNAPQTAFSTLKTWV
ncbi:MAG: hypothetical protein F6K01_07545 [Okeania sp. SIO1I7]|nr:hypothetical protein [Okeania sp. SIO1I7]